MNEFHHFCLIEMVENIPIAGANASLEMLNPNMMNRFSVNQILEIRRWAEEMIVKVFPTVSDAFVQAQTDILIWRYLRAFIFDDYYYFQLLKELKHRAEECDEKPPPDFKKLIDYLTHCVENLV